MSDTIAAFAAVAAFCAALAAYFQIRAVKLLEMLKFIESRDLRLARRKVIRGELGVRTDPWWDTDDDLEAAASDVCAAYDILGLMIEADWVEQCSIKGYSEFFQHWDYSVFRTHQELKAFLQVRRGGEYPHRYEAFSRLAAAAKARLQNRDGGGGVNRESAP